MLGNFFQKSRKIMFFGHIDIKAVFKLKILILNNRIRLLQLEINTMPATPSKETGSKIKNLQKKIDELIEKRDSYGFTHRN